MYSEKMQYLKFMTELFMERSKVAPLSLVLRVDDNIRIDEVPDEQLDQTLEALGFMFDNCGTMV